MLGKITVIQKDRKAVFIEFDKPVDFKINQIVNVSERKKVRTLKQNAMYWAFLTWCIHPFGGDLQSQGHFSVDALHADIKAWFTMTHGHEFPMDGKFTTTELDIKQFRRYFDIVNQELMVDTLGVDTSGFWADYERYRAWAEYNEENIGRYMEERYGRVRR